MAPTSIAPRRASNHVRFRGHRSPPPARTAQVLYAGSDVAGSIRASSCSRRPRSSALSHGLEDLAFTDPMDRRCAEGLALYHARECQETGMDANCSSRARRPCRVLLASVGCLCGRCAVPCGAGRAVARVRVPGGGARRDSRALRRSAAGPMIWSRCMRDRVLKSAIPASSAPGSRHHPRESNAQCLSPLERERVERECVTGGGRSTPRRANRALLTVAAAAKTDALDVLPRLRRQIGCLGSLGVDGSDLKQMPASSGLGCGHERGQPVTGVREREDTLQRGHRQTRPIAARIGPKVPKRADGRA